MMNLGGEAADQMVRYSLDGIDHGLRLTGSIAKNLAVFIAAVLKDQKKTHGKTNMLRMLKENRPLKFFTVPSDRIREFCKEGKKRGLLYVVIRDKKNPDKCELMVFADDAAKVNRVMDQMNLDFLKSESGEAVHEVTQESVKDAVNPVKTETVSMPDGEIQFEISDLDEEFNIQGAGKDAENFTPAQEQGKKNPSERSSRNSDFSIGEERDSKKPSVREELNQIKKEKQESSRKKKQRSQNRNQNRNRRNRKPNRKVKPKTKSKVR